MPLDDWPEIKRTLEMEDEERDAKTFLQYLKTAKKSGLELEFVQYFLREFRKTKDVDDSCWYAACEWDI